jgi:hypothetical protein
MRWKGTSPKKKQTLLLTGLGIAGIVALVVQFVVIPAGSELGYQREEARLRNGRIRQAENELKSEAKDRAKNQEMARTLQVLLDTLPPDTNPNLWVTERVYQIARHTGFSMDSLQEVATALPSWLQVPKGKIEADVETDGVGPEGGAPQPAAPKAAPKTPRFRFGPYRAQATGTSDYETLKQFFEELEKAFPLMAVQNLTVTVGTGPDRQAVGFTIEWPRDTGPQQERPPASGAGGETPKP